MKPYTENDLKSPIVVLNAPIEKLRVKVRIINDFKRLGIRNLSELINLINANNPKVLIFGKKSRAEIKKILSGIVELPASW